MIKFLLLLLLFSGVSVEDRARQALGTLPAGVELEPLNTALDVPSSGNFTCVVLSPCEGATPRVRVNLAGTDRNWIVAFRKIFRPRLLVATRPLKRGECPGAADVELAARQVYTGQTYLVSAEVLAGQRLKRNIPLGEPVRPGDLEPVPLVESGCTVTVVSAFNGVVMRREAKTLEAAYPDRPFRARTGEGRTLNVVYRNQEFVER